MFVFFQKQYLFRGWICGLAFYLAAAMKDTNWIIGHVKITETAILIGKKKKKIQQGTCTGHRLLLNTSQVTNVKTFNYIAVE